MAEAFTISNVNFSELGTRYTDILNFEALRVLPDRKS